MNIQRVGIKKTKLIQIKFLIIIKNRFQNTKKDLNQKQININIFQQLHLIKNTESTSEFLKKRKN